MEINKEKKFAASLSITSNALIILFKIIAGIVSGSISIISEAIHSFSDFLASVVTFFAVSRSSEPADKDHPFGHGKTEYITSMIIGLIIIILSLGIINSVFHKEITIPNILIIVVSIFTITSKFILASYISKKGKLYNNNILIASGKESKSDVYSSIFVLISILLMQFSNQINIFKYADIVGTIIIALFILHTGYRVLMDNISILLEEQVNDKDYIIG